MSSDAYYKPGESGSITNPQIYDRWVGMMSKGYEGMEHEWIFTKEQTGKPEGEFYFFTSVQWNDTMTGLDTMEFMMYYRRVYFLVKLTLKEAFTWYHDEASWYLRYNNIPYYVFKEEYEKFSGGKVNEIYREIVEERYYNVKSEETWENRKQMDHKEKPEEQQEDKKPEAK